MYVILKVLICLDFSSSVFFFSFLCVRTETFVLLLDITCKLTQSCQPTTQTSNTNYLNRLKVIVFVTAKYNSYKHSSHDNPSTRIQNFSSPNLISHPCSRITLRTPLPSQNYEQFYSHQRNFRSINLKTW